MPPAEAAISSHISRAHLQTIIWCAVEQQPPPPPPPPPQVDISEYGWKVDGQQTPEQVLGLQILLLLNYCRSLHAAARQTSLAQETIVTARKIKCPGQVTAHALQKNSVMFTSSQETSERDED